MSAIISTCGQYRYRLERQVDSLASAGLVFAFFGVNPSTADATEDDPTIRKLRGFTAANGGSRFIVGNVFAYRSTDVTALARAADPVGPENRRHLLAIAQDAQVLVPCWGARDKVPEKLRQHLDATLKLLLDAGRPVRIFGCTRSGDPKHPLMLSYQTKLEALG